MLPLRLGGENAEAHHGIDYHSGELHELSHSKILFERAIDSQQAHGVVGIHHHMYQRVEQSSEIAIAFGPEPNPKPPGPRNGEMVVHVEKRDLTESLVRWS